MERVQTIILILRDVVGVVVNRERAVLDSVRVTSDDRAEERAIGLAVVEVLLGVIVANQDILLLAVAIGDQDGGQTRAIGDQLRGDILRLDSVGLEVIVIGAARGWCRGRGGGRRGSGECKGREPVEGSREVRLEVHPDTEQSSDGKEQGAKNKDQLRRNSRRARE